MRALEHDPSGKMTVAEARSRDLVVTYPDEVLYDAAARMLRANVGRMPVVSRENPQQARGLPRPLENHVSPAAAAGRRARARAGMDASPATGITIILADPRPRRAHPMDGKFFAG